LKDVVLGRHLIARGMEPGRHFGAILQRCRAIQEETGLSDPQAILDRALAEETLRGQRAVEDSFRAAAEAELAAARPLLHNAFKVPLAINMITRVLVELAGDGR